MMMWQSPFDCDLSTPDRCPRLDAAAWSAKAASQPVSPTLPTAGACSSTSATGRNVWPRTAPTGVPLCRSQILRSLNTSWGRAASPQKAQSAPAVPASQQQLQIQEKDEQVRALSHPLRMRQVRLRIRTRALLHIRACLIPLLGPALPH